MDAEVQEIKPSVDMLAETYIKMRDKRSVLKQDWEAKDKAIEVQMKLVEEKLLEVCKEINANSISTNHGTIIRSTKSRYWTSDWDSMYQFIKEHDAFGLLEKRVQQTNMKNFLSENPDLLPMGLNVEHEYTVLVRRSKEK
jgi:hypothetical protein